MYVLETGAPAYEVLGALLGARAAAAAPSAAGFSVSYTDAGLVGVTGTCSNGEAGALAQALASCFSVSCGGTYTIRVALVWRLMPVGVASGVDGGGGGGRYGVLGFWCAFSGMLVYGRGESLFFRQGIKVKVAPAIPDRRDNTCTPFSATSA